MALCWQSGSSIGKWRKPLGWQDGGVAATELASQDSYFPSLNLQSLVLASAAASRHSTNHCRERLAEERLVLEQGRSSTCSKAVARSVETLDSGYCSYNSAFFNHILIVRDQVREEVVVESHCASSLGYGPNVHGKAIAIDSRSC